MGGTYSVEGPTETRSGTLLLDLMIEEGARSRAQIDVFGFPGQVRLSHNPGGTFLPVIIGQPIISEVVDGVPVDVALDEISFEARSSFRLVPEPGTATLLGLGLAWVTRLSRSNAGSKDRAHRG